MNETEFQGPVHAEQAQLPRPEDVVASLRERAVALDAEVRRFVVERPVVALVGAIAGGFLIGRLLSRS